MLVSVCLLSSAAMSQRSEAATVQPSWTDSPNNGTGLSSLVTASQRPGMLWTTALVQGFPRDVGPGSVVLTYTDEAGTWESTPPLVISWDCLDPETGDPTAVASTDDVLVEPDGSTVTVQLDTAQCQMYEGTQVWQDPGGGAQWSALVSLIDGEPAPPMPPLPPPDEELIWEWVEGEWNTELPNVIEWFCGAGPGGLMSAPITGMSYTPPDQLPGSFTVDVSDLGDCTLPMEDETFWQQGGTWEAIVAGEAPPETTLGSNPPQCEDLSYPVTEVECDQAVGMAMLQAAAWVVVLLVAGALTLYALRGR